jgi:hypothetical protein
MALGQLWNASARGALKLEMIEQGVVQRVTSDVYVRVIHPMPRCLNSCVAIVHNLSEFRFVRGQRNFLQSSIIAHCIPFLASVLERVAGTQLIVRDTVHMRFVACSAIANLSMEGSFVEQLQAHWHHLDEFFQLDTVRIMRLEIFNHWLTMTPFTGLLCSPHAPIVRFALRTLERFCRNPNDVPRVFRSLALTASVDHVRFWCDPTNASADHVTYACAEALLVALGVAPERELPDIAPPALLVGSVVGFDRAALGAFSDIALVATSDGVDSEPLEAHRVVLAARSTFFAAMFRSQMRDATERVVRVECDRDVFATMLEFMYNGRWGGNISAQTAVDLVSAVERFGVDGARELEFLLCHQIDSVETARALLELCAMHPKLTQLALCARSFVTRSEQTRVRQH